MKKTFLLAVFAVSIISFTGFSQQITVPSQMDFAGIQLKITEKAKKEIQADVDALTTSKKYFNEKVERAAEFMPIVERIFAEENLPDDFKYLAIQESGFIADAVSSSSAVGFWQFKKASAEEVGLRVDNIVDERQNIVSSSRGAAKYLQKNNFYFNNWIYALQAYQMGAGGALEALGEKKGGEKHLTINHKTYWYIKKFLAHKVAFDKAIEDARKRIPVLKEYENGAGKSLNEIAVETSVDPNTLKQYNTWLKSGKIPDDKVYVVIIPAEGNVAALASISTIASSVIPPPKPVDIESIKDDFKVIRINGLPAAITAVDMTIDELSELTETEATKLISYNDLLPHYTILSGQVYYLKKKRSKARIFYHTVKGGESIWFISQMYGISQHKLMNKNRITDKDSLLQPGRILWLRKMRPTKTPVEFKAGPGSQQ